MDILEQIAVDPACNSVALISAENSLRELWVVRASDIEFCVWREYAEEPGDHVPLPQWLKEQKAEHPAEQVTQ